VEFKSDFGATPSCYVPEDAALRKERLTLQDHATLNFLRKCYRRRSSRHYPFRTGNSL
jgi:hypothetical protein